MGARCTADWGSVYLYALRLCGKLQKSLSEWLWREGMGVCLGLVHLSGLSLSVPVAVKGRRTNNRATTLPKALSDSSYLNLLSMSLQKAANFCLCGRAQECAMAWDHPCLGSWLQNAR